MIRAAVVDVGTDLRPVLVALAQQGIRCRINEESGKQVIWVASEQEAVHAAALVEQLQQLRAQGAIPETTVANGGGLAGYFPVGQYVGNLLLAIRTAPVTLFLIAAALLVAAISQLGANLQPVESLFYPTLNPGPSAGLATLLSILGDISGPTDFLRTLTPALLHFGAVHLIFDTLWLWYFGRMIEGQQSSLLYFVVVLFIAFVSNTTQYLWEMSPNFGGLSGVVYGLLGYIWMWQTVIPSGRLRLPPAMIGFMLLALVLMEVFASGWIASAAHAGGLIAGMMAGLLTAAWRRFR